MARPRSDGLPTGWQFKHGSWWYVVQARYRHLFPGQRWIRLGADITSAYKVFSGLPIHQQEPDTTPRRLITIADLADHYQAHVVPLKAATYQTEKKRYLGAIRAGLGGFRVDAVRRKHARQLFQVTKDAKGLKTARETVGVLRHMLSHAVDLGLIDTNALMGMRLETARPRRRLVSWEEITRFRRDYATPLLDGYIGLKVLTGMDKAMMLALTVRDLRPDGLATVRRKNDSLPKLYPWDEDGQLRAALDAIQDYNQRMGVQSVYLFHTRTGQPYLPQIGGRLFDDDGRAFGKPHGFNSIWQRCMARWVGDGNERFTEHDLRKVPASAVSTEHAQQLLDHHSPATTRRVYQVGERVVQIANIRQDKSEK